MTQNSELFIEKIQVNTNDKLKIFAIQVPKGWFLYYTENS